MSTIRSRPYSLILPAIFLLAGLVAARPQAPATAAQSMPLTAPTPGDPEVAIGRLPNGLTYYVRANQKPERRAELRLVVKAGSVLEDDDQRGLAHMLEHMAFNGTQHFPGQQVVRFMESAGMRFGADVNAYTSFDETVYMLTIPTDKPEVIAKAFVILDDWARNISFDAGEIDKERGVVLEEWRSGRSADRRVADKARAIALKGSRYADRLPIGKPEIIQNFRIERLKQFYRDWYRPDLMAVMAVGDFDRSSVEQLIKSQFASMTATRAPRSRPTYNVPNHSGTVFAVATDKETTGALVQLETLLPGRAPGSVKTYRERIVDELFGRMFQSRFDELTQKPGVPLLYVFAAGRNPGLGRACGTCPPDEEMYLMAGVRADGVAGGVQALFTEVARVSEFGFSASELERQKRSLLRSREKAAADSNNLGSPARVSALVEHFLRDQPIVTAETAYALHQRFVPDITLTEINQRTHEWFASHNRIVTVTGPEKAGLTMPNEQALAAAIKAGSAADPTPWIDVLIDAPLLDRVPEAGAVVKTTARADIGLTEWELSNGVKVVLKPTAFKKDEVVFRATSPGGTSLADDRDYIAAAETGLIVAGGVGRMSGIELTKYMQDKVASALPSIGELEEGMSGAASIRDLETMFQLIYLRFTQPRVDLTTYGVEQANMKAWLANQAASPDFAFDQALTLARFQNHPRRQPTTLSTVDQWNLDKSAAFYRDRFADASDFTFVFVGSFDPQAIRPLVERYLGSLPSTHRTETWRDVGVRTPSGIVEKIVEKGIDPKGRTAIVFSGPFDYTPGERGVAFLSMTNILQRRLTETIREELGGTYGISVDRQFFKIPNPEYQINVQFGHDPRRAEELTRRVFAEIERFRSSGPTEQEVSDERLARLREFETSAQRNNFLADQLIARYRLGEDPASVWDRPEYYQKLSAAAIQAAAAKYLNTKRYVKVVLLPERK